MKAEVNKNWRKRLPPFPLFPVNVMLPALTVFLVLTLQRSLNRATAPMLRQTTRSSQPSPRDVPRSKPIGDHLEVPLLCAVGYSVRPEMEERFRVCEHVRLRARGGGRDAGQNTADCRLSTLKIRLVRSFGENVRNRHSYSQTINSLSLQINT